MRDIDLQFLVRSSPSLRTFSRGRVTVGDGGYIVSEIMSYPTLDAGEQKKNNLFSIFLEQMLREANDIFFLKPHTHNVLTERSAIHRYTVLIQRTPWRSRKWTEKKALSNDRNSLEICIQFHMSKAVSCKNKLYVYHYSSWTRRKDLY